MNISELLNTGTAVNLTMSVADLKEFAMNIVDEVRRLDAAKPKEDRRLSLRETAELLSVSENTLWRWEKIGYLVPAARVGHKPIYLQSQIDKLKSN